MELEELLDLFAQALVNADIDAQYRNYHPGIGACTEIMQVSRIRNYLNNNQHFVTREVPYPDDNNLRADLVVNNEWVIEFKILRPLGNNGEPNGTSWYGKIMYPFNNVNSALNDVGKLMNSNFHYRKAMVLLAHYNQESIDAIEQTVESFNNAITQNYPNNQFNHQFSEQIDGLVHPVMNSLKIFGWEFD